MAVCYLGLFLRLISLCRGISQNFPPSLPPLALGNSFLKNFAEFIFAIGQNIKIKIFRVVCFRDSPIFVEFIYKIFRENIFRENLISGIEVIMTEKSFCSKLLIFAKIWISVAN